MLSGTNVQAFFGYRGPMLRPVSVIWAGTNAKACFTHLGWLYGLGFRAVGWLSGLGFTAHGCGLASGFRI